MVIVLHLTKFFSEFFSNSRRNFQCVPFTEVQMQYPVYYRDQWYRTVGWKSWITIRRIVWRTVRRNREKLRFIFFWKVQGLAETQFCTCLKKSITLDIKKKRCYLIPTNIKAKYICLLSPLFRRFPGSTVAL